MLQTIISLLPAVLLATLAAAAPAAAEGEEMDIELTSKAFAPEEMIPRRHTCDGEDVSPPLAWRRLPPGTKSLALIVDDPDAPARTWVHWIVYNLPAASSGLPEGVPPDKTVAGDGRQGRNDFGRIGYGGPCPPGGVHRYYFKLYALDTELDLPPGASKAELLQSMAGHVLGEGQLMGRYRR